MPPSGGGRRNTILAVGNPRARPSFAPCATRPLRVYGCPSRRSARRRSPAPSAPRTAELETRSPSNSTSGIAASSSVAKSPARRAPKRKSRPTSSQRVPSPRSSTSSTKRSAASDAKRASKRTMCTRLMPVVAKSSSLSRRRVRRAGAASREKNSRGCGSKVRTQEASFNSRAFAATRSMSARWPRCTPSKLPMVSAHRPRVACNEPCVTTMETVKILNYSVFMKTLEEQMAFYAAYHQDVRNKATHFVGVPAIMLSLFIPLAWLRIELGGVAISAVMLFAAAVVVYYFLLDVPLALAMLLITGILVWSGERIAGQGMAQVWVWFGVLFVGGWILQLVGHVFEGRKPALTDNLFQIFVAPIFLCAELFFALGYKAARHGAVQRRALGMRTGAGASCRETGFSRRGFDATAARAVA